MNNEEYTLTLIAEECNEVAQRATKALRFGLHETQEGQNYTNRERLLQEFWDLTTVMRMLYPDVDFENEDWSKNKIQKIEKYKKYSKQLNRLDE
jgi:NTP pyrophosphatase (non-canonical NTP hydrolase)